VSGTCRAAPGKKSNRATAHQCPGAISGRLAAAREDKCFRAGTCHRDELVERLAARREPPDFVPEVLPGVERDDLGAADHRPVSLNRESAAESRADDFERFEIGDAWLASARCPHNEPVSGRGGWSSTGPLLSSIGSGQGPVADVVPPHIIDEDVRGDQHPGGRQRPIRRSKLQDFSA